MKNAGIPDALVGQPLIPRGEVPCVWMDAGVLTFRLCDRGLECSTCPLDNALRNSPELAHRVTRTERPPATRSGCLVPEDVFFHPGHTWVRIGTDGTLTIGVDDLGSRLVGRIESVGLPTAGDTLTADRPAIRLAGSTGEVDLDAPFTGIVIEANPALIAEPDLVRSAPFGDGYLLKARPVNPARALTSLLSGTVAQNWAAAEETLVRALVDVVTARSGQPTLNDGGTLSNNLLAGLPPVKAERIRNQIFHAPAAGREAKEQ